MLLPFLFGQLLIECAKLFVDQSVTGKTGGAAAQVRGKKAVAAVVAVLDVHAAETIVRIKTFITQFALFNSEAVATIF